MSSRENSTTPAYQAYGSHINVSADATGLGEATLPTLKKRKYSEIHDASGDSVGENGDVVSTTSKRVNASRPLMTTTVNQAGSVRSSEDGNTMPTAHPDRGPHVEFPANTTDLKGAPFPAPKKRWRFPGCIGVWAQLANARGDANLATLEQSQLKFEAGHDHGAQMASPRSVMNEHEFQSISGNGTRRHSEYRYTSGGMKDEKGDDASATYEQNQLKIKRSIVAQMVALPELSKSFGMYGEPACAYQPTTRRDPDLMPAVGLIITRLKQGGRLIYIGAGADGCLGVLDVAELARKFSASPASFIRLIAGGAMAVEHAARAAEDAPDAVADLGALMTPLTTPSDILIGVVTSRSMTYALAGMSHARALGALTIGFTYANWSAPGDPRICECVVECDPKLKSGWENSETEKNREIQSVLIKLSKKLGEYTRPSGGMVETGAPDGRDKNVAPRRCTGARGIAHTKREAGATVAEKDRSEGLLSLVAPILSTGNGHDTATSNQELVC